MSEIVISTTEQRLGEQVSELRARLAEARGQVSSLTGEGWVPQSHLQSHAARQRVALRRLNERVRVQRLILRELASRDPQLANELYNTVMDKYAAELDQDRGDLSV